MIAARSWTYTWAQKDQEKMVPWRNVNQFKDNDHSHFELQSMEDGGIWKTPVRREARDGRFSCC